MQGAGQGGHTPHYNIKKYNKGSFKTVTVLQKIIIVFFVWEIVIRKWLSARLKLKVITLSI